MKLIAVEVLPLPVDIWIGARGLLAARLFSRLLMATICTGQGLKSPHSVIGSGTTCSRASILPPVVSTMAGAAGGSALAWASQSASVSGRCKANTARARGTGPRPRVNWVSMPMLS